MVKLFCLCSVYPERSVHHNTLYTGGHILAHHNITSPLPSSIPGPDHIWCWPGPRDHVTADNNMIIQSAANDQGLMISLMTQLPQLKPEYLLRTLKWASYRISREAFLTTLTFDAFDNNVIRVQVSFFNNEIINITHIVCSGLVNM